MGREDGPEVGPPEVPSNINRSVILWAGPAFGREQAQKSLLTPVVMSCSVQAPFPEVDLLLAVKSCT